MMKVSINGKIEDEDKAGIQAVSDGLFYGAGCFDTLKSYQGRFLHLHLHIERLNRGVGYLTGQETDFLKEAVLRQELLKLLRANELEDKDARVRIQISLVGRRGYALPNDNHLNLNTLITAHNVTGQTFEPVQLKTVETTVVPSSSRPTDLKLSNMLHYRQAAIEARKKDGDDALMLTTDGYVAETSIANIFWKKRDTVYTPSTDCDILPGITRSLIIQLVKELGYSVNEGQFRPNELIAADTAWICNSIREIVWIKSIDDQKFSADRDFQDELVSRFERYKTQHTA